MLKPFEIFDKSIGRRASFADSVPAPGPDLRASQAVPIIMVLPIGWEEQVSASRSWVGLFQQSRPVLQHPSTSLD